MIVTAPYSEVAEDLHLEVTEEVNQVLSDLREQTRHLLRDHSAHLAAADHQLDSAVEVQTLAVAEVVAVPVSVEQEAVEVPVSVATAMAEEVPVLEEVTLVADADKTII